MRDQVVVLHNVDSPRLRRKLGHDSEQLLGHAAATSLPREPERLVRVEERREDWETRGGRVIDVEGEGGGRGGDRGEALGIIE